MLGQRGALQQAARAQFQQIGGLGQRHRRDLVQAPQIVFAVAHGIGHVVAQRFVITAHQQGLGQVPQLGEAPVAVEPGEAALFAAHFAGLWRIGPA